jgi:hypothetical protein
MDFVVISLGFSCLELNSLSFIVLTRVFEPN